jgi:Ser/Thr protein kinase RdoA (MazF antagonist)
VAEISPPEDVLLAAGLDESRVERVGRGSRVWIATASNCSVVLRRCRQDAPGWLHPILRALATRFPVPTPLDVFGGRSFLAHRSGVWEVVSLLPGRAIGVLATPPLDEIGAFLAAFHETSLPVTFGFGPRPAGTRLVRLRKLFDPHAVAATLRSPERVELLCRLVDRFAAALDHIGYAQCPTCVVHGDPTAFNVLSDGDPRGQPV